MSRQFEQVSSAGEWPGEVRSWTARLTRDARADGWNPGCVRWEATSNGSRERAARSNVPVAESYACSVYELSVGIRAYARALTVRSITTSNGGLTVGWIGKAVGLTFAGFLAVGIVQAVMATPSTPSEPYPTHVVRLVRTAPSASDTAYCRALHTWNRVGVPTDAQTRLVARRALRASGKYRHSGTALVAAIVAGGSSSSEARYALTVCKGVGK